MVSELLFRSPRGPAVQGSRLSGMEFRKSGEKIIGMSRMRLPDDADRLI